MSCQELFNSIGLLCRALSDGVYRVMTPLSFCDGEPIGMYVVQMGNSIRISDNADTLFHFRNVGRDVGDRKKWKWIDNIVSMSGLELTNSGEITGSASISSAAPLVANYISAMVRVSDAEREAAGIPEGVENFVYEVESYLRLWKPNLEVTPEPSFMGHSGRHHKFHLRFGNELVDAVRPHSNSTGSILRKSADILNTPSAPGIMIVMDDREDSERAKTESDILATMVKVLPFSHLVENLSGAPRLTH